MQDEIWKDVPNYEGIYQISNLGRVKSLDRYVNTGIKNSSTRFIKGQILKQWSDKDGYKIVNLKKHQIGSFSRVHRLIAQSFIPNPENKPQINHIDGVKFNNNLSNLEWVTLSENRIHAYNTGLQDGKSREGIKNNFVKLTESDVINIRNTYKKGVITQKKLGDLYGVSEACIQLIVNNKNWKFLL